MSGPASLRPVVTEWFPIVPFFVFGSVYVRVIKLYHCYSLYLVVLQKHQVLKDRDLGRGLDSGNATADFLFGGGVWQVKVLALV